MKVIKYQIPGKMEVYDPETDAIIEVETPATIEVPYTKENLETAKEHGIGEPIIEDDGQDEQEQEPSEEDTTLDLLADHEYRLCMLELGGETE